MSTVSHYSPTTAHVWGAFNHQWIKENSPLSNCIKSNSATQSQVCDYQQSTGGPALQAQMDLATPTVYQNSQMLTLLWSLWGGWGMSGLGWRRVSNRVVRQQWLGGGAENIGLNGQLWQETDGFQRAARCSGVTGQVVGRLNQIPDRFSYSTLHMEAFHPLRLHVVDFSCVCV